MTASTTTLNAGSGGAAVLDDTLSTVDGGAAPSSAIAQMIKLGYGAQGDFNTVSLAQPYPISETDRVYTGSLTAAAQSVTAATSGDGGALVQVTGTFVGTLAFQGSMDGGTTWIPIVAAIDNQAGQGLTTGHLAASSFTNAQFTAPAIFRISGGGFAQIRVTMSAYTSGTATISLSTVSPVGQVIANEPIPDNYYYNQAGVIAISTTVMLIDCAKYRTLSIHVLSMGTSGALQLQWSNDGANWFIGTYNTGSAQATTITTSNLVTIPVIARYFQLVMSTATTAGTTWLNLAGFNATSGPPTVQQVNSPTAAWFACTATQAVGTAATRWYAQISDGSNSPAIKAASTASAFTDAAITVSVRPGDAMLTASAAMADAFANPTIGKQAVLGMVYNGTTWDLARGMGGNATTGDTGAKAATGNGATLTNVGNKGVQVVVNMGAVTGTTPTCVIKLQGSADGGTTWFDIPGATTASLVATGVFGITVYPGLPTTAATTTTGTTAQCNAVLPRTWRTVWTIGGTTPSFTITNIQYNYISN